MFFVISVVLLILKLTVLPAISWWIVAAPLLVWLGIWICILAVAVIATIITWTFLD